MYFQISEIYNALHRPYIAYLLSDECNLKYFHFLMHRFYEKLDNLVMLKKFYWIRPIEEKILKEKKSISMTKEWIQN